MHVVIFEGSKWPTFAPLALSRPVFMLASGAGTLLDKHIRHLAPTKLTLWVRPAMAAFCRRYVLPGLTVPTTVNEPLGDEPALLVSGRTLHLSNFEVPAAPASAVDTGDLLRCAYVKSPGLSPEDAMKRSDAWRRVLDLPRMPSPPGQMAQYLWDLVRWNTTSLIDDGGRMAATKPEHPPGAYHMVDEDRVWLAGGVKPEPGCVLDASKGPVMVAAGAVLGANCVIQGPCAIGAHSTVMPVALVRPGTTIGPGCKVGGEISNSIIQGNSNKSHEGFLGDSYLGEWVNLGAGTTTSNLKNTYGEVSMRIGAREIASGHNFLGSIVGDHAKTAIGTRLMTGSYVGFCSMLAGSAHAPRFVPSLSFWTDRGMEPYRPEKAIEVMQRVFSRRQRKWLSEDAELLRYVAETAPSIEKS